jgi:heat shock factor-binding protein 1
MSDNIIHKIDEMGNRIDDLERSVNDLMDEAGLEDSVPGKHSDS